MVRLIPDMVAYPYPIGYDVINYYIPVITNFHEHWSFVSEQFPLYILILHFFQIVTNLQPQILVSASGVILYGSFSVSLFLMSRKLLGLDELYSLYLTLFVIFQLPVLRTAWDLHKDIFSLTLLLISASLIYSSRAKMGRYSMVGSSVAASVAVSADRMVGALFVALLMIYGIAVRSKYITLILLLTAGFFVAAIVSDYGNVRQSLQTLTESAVINRDVQLEPYDPKNLLMLFMAINGPLLVPAAFGFMRSDNWLLRISVGITAAGSFSWLIFPDGQSLAADRWIFLFGIFLSIFAGYGVIRYSQTKICPAFGSYVLCLVLGVSATFGLLYEIMPYHFASVLESVLENSIVPFGPVTMQFNSIPVKDNKELLETISWINENTPKNATIMGEGHWRGWMEIKLQQDRSFVFFSNRFEVLQYIQDCKLGYCYLMHSTDSLDYLSKEEAIDQVYHSRLFKIYKVAT